MSVGSVAIKGAKTVGKYSLKGFEKGGKFIGRNSLALLGNVVKSKPVKQVAGIGMTIGAMYLFGPAIITAKLFKDLVIDNCIFNKNKSVMDSVKSSIEMTKDTMQKTIADSVLDSIGNGIRHAGDKIFDKGGER